MAVAPQRAPDEVVQRGWRGDRGAPIRTMTPPTPQGVQLLPRVVPVRASGIFSGDGWMGVKMRDASVVKGVGVLPMFAGLIGLLLLLGAFAATWLREGR